jgi:hypothetical protein
LHRHGLRNKESPTGRRKKTPIRDETKQPATTDRRTEMLRRLLLALITALIVARPLVLGEDPGLLDRLTNAWSLLLSLLWFLAVAGWAVWRAWSGQTTWRGSGVEAGLFSVAALLWLSAGVAAHYKHPAILIASEWLVLFCAFCLVRQLSRTPEDDRGLMAAFLASAVSISAFAIYQYTVEFPQIRRAYGSNLDALVEAMASENVVANPQLLQRRLFEDNVFATYSHPNAFAGYLALLLPLAIAWTFHATRPPAVRERPSLALRAQVLRGAFILAAAATLLVGLALWLTHSRGAILGSLVVGAVVLAAYGRRFLAMHKTAFVTALAFVAVAAFFVSRTQIAANGMAKFWQSSAKRNDYWIATWSMIEDHPWFGVGPGNFGRLYPRYMLPRAFEKIKDPHNLILELWATAGLFALIALVVTLGLCFRQAWTRVAGGGWRSAGTASDHPPPTTHHPPPAGTRWEFYLGGMLGLVLGFVLRAMNQLPDEIVLEGAYSFCRSIVWFAAFALFYSIPWRGPSRTVAVLAGIAALLLNLMVSGGIGMPSVAQPLWIMAALSLNSLSPFSAGGEGAVRGRSTTWLPRMLPLPLLSGLVLAYFVLIFSPAVGCGDALVLARRYYKDWPQIRYSLDIDKCCITGVVGSGAGGPLQALPMLALRPDELAKQASARRRFANHYLREILGPLEQAVKTDPGNATAWLELAEWYAEEAKLSPEPNFARALQCAEQACFLDPDNKDPYLFKGRLYTLLAARLPQREKAAYGQAAAALKAAVERDPTDARLRYQLAQSLFWADLPVEGRYQAKIAQQLDEQATWPERELAGAQRKQIQSWLSNAD